MSQSARVLVIPSWYPTAANPVAGSQFQEQSALLEQRYDVRVLFGIGHRVGYRSALRQHRWFPRRGLARVRPMRTDTIAHRPPEVRFEYFHRSADDTAWLSAAIDAYRQMLGRLVAEGWKPDFLHARCAEFAGIVASRLSQDLGVPWVLTEHQMLDLTAYSEYRRRLMIDALRTATMLVAVSNHQLRCIALQGIYRPIAVVGNLVDEEVFGFSEPQRDQDRFRILTVTYPSPIKDCETFFRAIALVLQRGHRDILVTVIGNNSFHDLSGANTKEYERLAVRFGVERACRFIAYVERTAMPKYYAESDVFVSTSIAETFGISVREAMAVGRPVVCTASGGVEDDLSLVNGVKADIGDYEAVAEALIAIKTGRLKFYPAEVRNSVISKHGRQAYLDQMTAVYEDAIADLRKLGVV